MTDTEIDRLKPKDRSYTVGFGNGLYMHISPTGKKLWRYNYKYKDGTSTTVSLGEWPMRTCEQAREMLSFYRKYMAAGYRAREIRIALEEMNPESQIKIIKISDGRTLVVAHPKGEAIDVAEAIDVSDLTSDRLQELHRSLCLATEARELMNRLK